MSLCRKPRSPFWYYDFKLKGRRYRGSTKTESEQEAHVVECEARLHAKQGLWNKLNPREPRRRADRYCGLCACSEHAWAVLTKGYVTFVSPEDVRHLSEANWYAASSGQRLFYAARKKNGIVIRLHRVILGEVEQGTDHKDHNGLNNRRDNLRPCSPLQNGGNSRQWTGFSDFRGVYCDPRTGRWIAQVAHRKFGVFETPEEAARAYDVAAIDRYGEFATLNFPEGAA